MVTISMVNNILGVAKSLFGLFDKFKGARQERRNAMADLFENISNCLANVSGEIRIGQVPHGRCGELITYAQELPSKISSEVGEAKAKELGDTLLSAYNVEGLAMELSSVKEKEPFLRKIEEASGKFKALANLIRAT